MNNKQLNEAVERLQIKFPYYTKEEIAQSINKAQVWFDKLEQKSR